MSGRLDLRMKNTMLERLFLKFDVDVQAMAICRVSKGVRLHFSPLSAIEVHYVLEGTMHLTVPGAASIICERGSVIIVPPETLHSVAAGEFCSQDVIAAKHCSKTRNELLLYDAADGDTGDLRLVCGIITVNAFGSLGPLDGLTKPIARNLMETPIIRQAFATMLNESTAPRDGSRAVLGALMKLCLVKALESNIDAFGIQSVQLAYLCAPQLHRTVAAIMDQPAAAFSVATLASIAGMSRSTFARQFLEAFAMTPMEFVKKTRLHHAAELLRSTAVPIKKISDNVGFRSRSHFSKAFREAYGTPPRSFRAPRPPQH